MYHLKVYIHEIADKKTDDIKNFIVRIEDKDEITKLKNILKQYQTEKKLSIPVTISDCVCMKISTQKLSRYVNTKTNAIEWLGHSANLQFKIQKYNFKNKDASKGILGFEVSGLRFILTSLIF
jgi:hypothetical protein